MVSVNAIAAWGITHPGASADQVEQHLLLSRAICAIADDSHLGGELLFRGAPPCANSTCHNRCATAKTSTTSAPPEVASAR
jgi:hypothetical protein